LAAWGEFLGGIAVVVSLIYLAGQIRSNTKTVRASNFGDLLAESNGFTAMLVDPETASLYVRGLDDFVGLSAEDQARFTGLMVQTFNHCYRAWNLHGQALLDDKLWKTQAHFLDTSLRSPGVRQWWEVSQHYWQAEFREVVQDLVGE